MPIQSLHTGYSGLNVAQIGIDTTSNNVANANTEGYARQRIDQRALPNIDKIVGRLGTGVKVDDITAARDLFLDARVRDARAQTAGYSANAELLARAEGLLGEPDFGIASALDDLWNGLEDLSLDPSDAGKRTTVKNQLEVIAGRFNAIAEGMDDLVADTGTQLTSELKDINLVIDEIAELNGSIQQVIASRSTPNDLIDRRNLLLDELSEKLGVHVTHLDNASVRVSLNGLALVDGQSAKHVSWDASSLQLLHANGSALRAGGSVGGFQSFIVDDAASINTQLDQLAIDIHDAMNTRHAAGFVDSGVAGGALFSYDITDPARTLTSVLASIDDLAVSGVDGTPFPIHDGDNARFMAELRNEALGPGSPILLESARGLVTDIGSRTAQALASADANADLQLSAELQRSGATGVNIDEEMVALIQYQRAYEAAARVITAADEALNTLINRTGLVGR
ncbi:MAG: flagellar hook-associated protein FlgK [Acidimicrobiales bacterium]|nr:flagellar hook-associated protein FlgK [Acidimicrobiales bacterium]